MLMVIRSVSSYSAGKETEAPGLRNITRVSELVTGEQRWKPGLLHDKPQALQHRFSLLLPMSPPLVQPIPTGSREL